MPHTDHASPTVPRVAIIGGGYTGTALAIHLLRRAQGPLHLCVIDPAEALGRGVAYAARDPEHRINVPSDRMSLFGDDHGHATRWLFAQDVLPDPASTDAQEHHYVARAAYGRYVGAMLDEAVAAAGPGVRFSHARARATAVAADGPAWSIRLSDGRTVAADRVVLCFGHAPPAPPCRIGDAALRHPAFVGNPWAPDASASIPPEAAVLIVGTGLTMADAVASLLSRGHRGTLTAVSRRGLLAQPHGLFGDGGDVLDGGPPPATARALLRLVRRRVARNRDAEGWHPTIDALRAKLPEIWGALPDSEKRKVMRRLLPFWEVHRFRIAPQVHARLIAAREAGQLTVEAAALVGLEHDGHGFAATLRRPGGAQAVRRFDAVVLCTGPDKDPARNAVVAALLDAGLAMRDAVGIGLRVDVDFRVLDPSGRPHAGLLAIGPIVRGSFGEMTGAPDITRHIEDLAPQLLAGLRAGGPAGT